MWHLCLSIQHLLVTDDTFWWLSRWSCWASMLFVICLSPKMPVIFHSSLIQNFSYGFSVFTLHGGSYRCFVSLYYFSCYILDLFYTFLHCSNSSHMEFCCCLQWMWQCNVSENWVTWWSWDNILRIDVIWWGTWSPWNITPWFSSLSFTLDVTLPWSDLMIPLNTPNSEVWRA